MKRLCGVLPRDISVLWKAWYGIWVHMLVLMRLIRLAVRVLSCEPLTMYSNHVNDLPLTGCRSGHINLRLPVSAEILLCRCRRKPGAHHSACSMVIYFRGTMQLTAAIRRRSYAAAKIRSKDRRT